MGRMATAWREDRRQFISIFGHLVVGAGFVYVNWGRGWGVGVLAVLYTGLVAYQAVDVLVVRPRRLERTGSRDKPRRSGR